MPDQEIPPMGTLLPGALLTVTPESGNRRVYRFTGSEFVRLVAPYDIPPTSWEQMCQRSGKVGYLMEVPYPDFRDSTGKVTTRGDLLRMLAERRAATERRIVARLTDAGVDLNAAEAEQLAREIASDWYDKPAKENDDGS